MIGSCTKDLWTHPRLPHRIAHITMLPGGTYCETDIKRGPRPRSDGTQRVPCDLGEVRKERGVGENGRDLNECKYSGGNDNYRTHISTATARRKEKIESFLPENPLLPATRSAGNLSNPAAPRGIVR